MQAELKAKYVRSRPIVGSLPGELDIFEYKGYRYSVFYHPMYQSYQIGLAAPYKAGWSLLGKNWRDVAVDSAKTLEAAHALAQSEIERMSSEAAAKKKGASRSSRRRRQK